MSDFQQRIKNVTPKLGAVVVEAQRSERIKKIIGGALVSKSGNGLYYLIECEEGGDTLRWYKHSHSSVNWQAIVWHGANLDMRVTRVAQGYIHLTYPVGCPLRTKFLQEGTQ